MSDSVTLTDGLADLRNEFTRFMLSYKFGIDEMMTKINILKDEFAYTHDYSPIEHVNSRLKSPESILAKAQRIGCEGTLEAMRENINDIAGVRITCSFISDAYRISEMITGQADVTVVQVKDYIAQPKPNGYKSLHLILELPVFMSEAIVPVRVEVQIRTIAMDFWASLEHKIYYKYDRDVPGELLDELKQAADVASRLDVTMERLHDQVRALDGSRLSLAGPAEDEPATFPPGLLMAALAQREQRES